MLCSCIPVGLIFRLHLEFSVFLVLYWFEQSSDSCTAAVKSLHPNMCIAAFCCTPNCNGIVSQLSYLFSLLCGFFLYKKKPSFHQKSIVKCNSLFCFYSKMIRLESFLCKNRYIARQKLKPDKKWLTKQKLFEGTQTKNGFFFWSPLLFLFVSWPSSLGITWSSLKGIALEFSCQRGV